MNLEVSISGNHTLKINDLSRFERRKKRGDPKNEGISTEVYENKMAKKIILVSLQKLLKNNLVICFSGEVFEKERDIEKMGVQKAKGSPVVKRKCPVVGAVQAQATSFPACSYPAEIIGLAAQRSPFDFSSGGWFDEHQSSFAPRLPASNGEGSRGHVCKKGYLA